MSKAYEIATKLMGNSFYGKIIKDPANTNEWMKRMQEIFNLVVRNSPWALRFILDHLKTQETCDKAVDINPLLLAYVPDCFKTPKNMQ